MLRVLIVDDEKIVRKGLVSFMPWKEYGMEVVGDVGNGEAALQFLLTNKVDLLLTDLSMPMMSGIELMRKVRAEYPHVQIVVLTLHQDFEYIQEALRLGAIDYIAKTQLEKEQFEDVLGRIASLMAQKVPQEAVVQQDHFKDADEIVVLYALSQQSEHGIGVVFAAEAYEADIGIWCWTNLSKREQEALLQEIQSWAHQNESEYALVCFQGVLGLDRKELLQLFRAYRKHDLFYSYDPEQPFQTVHYDALAKKNKEDGGLDSGQLKEKWISAEWIYNDQLYVKMLDELKNIKLPPIRLTRVFYSITDEWNRLYGRLLSKPIMIDDFLTSWYHFERWLQSARQSIKVANHKSAYSEEIQNSIMKAVVLAQQMLSEPPTAGELAALVNMSSSYFSQCFKDIMGQTYTDYLREIRMDRAMEYLRSTSKTIQWIAEQVGYNDEKYFSRLFREQVGMVPSEYRQLHIK